MKAKEDDGFEEEDKRGKGAEEGERKGRVVNNGECFIIDVEESEEGSRKINVEEKVCRICHFSKEPSSKEMKLISLGCDCKGELGSSHHHCAEVWFAHKGDRICEICGKIAKNVDNTNVEEEERSIFMTEWNEMRMMAFSLDYSHESSHRCKCFICNVLLVCFVVLFLFMWFFHEIGLV